MTSANGMHVGRSWNGTEIEDSCPCEKAICGLAIMGRFDPECTWHDLTKTIRQGHAAEFCPGEGY